MINKQKAAKYTLFLFTFLALWVLLFEKCRYGFPQDEAFYILFCHRFMNGDIPILHEWNPTQISAIWLQPFVWIYYKIFGSSDGIILFFRYLFTVIWGFATLFLFYRLCKLSFWGAFVSSLLFLIFVPYGQMALYYNTIGLICVTFALVIIITAENKVYQQYMVSGFMFAVAVTCCPFLLVMYIALLFAALACLLRKQKLLLHLFCCITIGAIPAVILVYWFYVAPSSLKDVIHGLNHLIADRQHQFTYLEKFIGFFKNIHASSKFVLPLTMIVIIATIISKLSRSKTVITVAFLVVCISEMFLNGSYIISIGKPSNCFVFSPIFVGFYCGVLTDNKTSKRLFYNLYIPGMIYMFCINISSNVGFEASIIPSVICFIASVFMFVFFWKEICVPSQNELLKKNCLVVFSFVVLFSFVGQLCVMSFFSYADERKNELKDEINSGPLKGIYTSESKYSIYSSTVKDLKTLKDYDSEKILLLTGFWYYLDIDKKPSCSSCFFSADNYYLDQLEEYYNLYPQFIPDIIYLGNDHLDLLNRVKNYGYQGVKTETGAHILFKEDNQA